MKEQKSSHIINVSSVAGHKVNPGGAVYATTKHGVRVISEGLRQEVKPHNIRTTIILPGAVATELPDSITEPDVAERVRKVYELAIPADSFASMVAFAMSCRRTSTSTKSCSGRRSRNIEIEGGRSRPPSP
jgi:NADP-dependent 3-hydroxy acid dehydrogenase YdfG